MRILPHDQPYDQYHNMTSHITNSIICLIDLLDCHVPNNVLCSIYNIIINDIQVVLLSKHIVVSVNRNFIPYMLMCTLGISNNRGYSPEPKFYSKNTDSYILSTYDEQNL